MDITVTLKVKVDVDGWQTEYGHANPALALKEVLEDLSESGYYLTGAKWEHLAKVKKADAVVNLY